MRRFAAFLMAAALAATPALGALRYKALTTSGGDGQDDSKIAVEGWVDGERAEIHFRESDNEWMETGFYMVTTDGGNTVVMVDPENETYSEWDVGLVLRFAGAMMEGMGPLLNFKIENSKVELVSQSPGEKMHGLDTILHVFHTEYDMLMRILGMKREQHIESKSRIWTTKDLSDYVAVGIWLRKDAPETGHEEFDKLAKSAWDRAGGDPPLKMEEESISTTKKGKKQKTWSKFMVTELDRSAGDPPAGYGWPAHFTKTQMMPTEAELSGQQGGEGEDGKKKKKKRFGGLFDGAS